MNALEYARSLVAHARVHHPIVEGVRIESTPYLTLPFRKSELIQAVNECDYTIPLTSWKPYAVQEGFYYSKQEQRIHGKRKHGGVDIFAPYGTPIVAPCDGIAIASYHSYALIDAKNRPIRVDGKQAYFGLGYFVQILAQNGRIIQLGHLSDISTHIPFSIPVYKSYSDMWEPTNHTHPLQVLQNHPMAVNISRGDPVGFLGYSGLRKGYQDYFEGMDRPYQLDPSIYKSWDSEHLHIEEATRNYETGEKQHQRDIYDLYATASRYPDPFKKHHRIGSQTLFELDSVENPNFTP